MCAVVGCSLTDPTKAQLETLQKLFLESQIRGRHQTGLAVVKSEKVERFVVDGDAHVLVERFSWSDLPSEKLELVGHCRYSTSDLRFPQPIQTENDFALCHNGVVTQEPPSTWGRFGYELSTSNDSELFYHCRGKGGNPLEEFPDASAAVCELSTKTGLTWYRNHKRPLYYSKVENGVFVCSTADIAFRAGLRGVQSCQPGTFYTEEAT
jgi:glutamine phosphoribosylpyrophosphate amidotransferase